MPKTTVKSVNFGIGPEQQHDDRTHVAYSASRSGASHGRMINRLLRNKVVS